MKYKIDWLEVRQTTTGKTKADATLTNENGEQFNNVGIWGDFPNFDKLAPGGMVEGDILTKVYNGKQYIDLAPLKPQNTFSGRTGGAGGIKAAQERKADMIEKAQDRKNESISYFNAINSAIALMKILPQLQSDEDIKQAITYWRDWFLAEWQKYESSDNTNKHQPF